MVQALVLCQCSSFMLELQLSRSVYGFVLHVTFNVCSKVKLICIFSFIVKFLSSGVLILRERENEKKKYKCESICRSAPAFYNNISFCMHLGRILYCFG